MDGILRDIAIGLAVLFLGFAGVVSAALEAVSRALGWRAANLWRWVRKTMEGPPPRKKTRIEQGTGTWLLGGALGQVPSNVGAENRAEAVEVEVRKLLSLGSKRINSIPRNDFARAVSKLTLGDPSGTSSFDEAIEKVNGWDDTVPIKRALLHILREAEEKREVVIDRLGDWFDEQMGLLTDLYRRNLRILSFICGLVLAALFNLNAFNAVDVLHSDAAMRNAGVDAGQQIVEQCESEPPEKQRQCASEASETFFSSKELVEWYGLFDDDDRDRRFQRGVWAPLGVLVSAGAIALGAPFWLSALKRLTRNPSKTT